MTLHQKILVALMALEIVFIPLFLKYMWPKKNKKSLVFKQLCSLIFVTEGYLCISIADNRTVFAYAMIAGLMCGFMGDFFLHLHGKVVFGIGSVFFLFNHLCYCYAYIVTRNRLFPESNELFLYVLEIAIVAVMVGVATVYAKKHNFNFMGLAPLIFIYSCVLSFMLVNAIVLGILLVLSDMPHSGIGASMLISGAALFFASDFSLGIILLGGMKSYPFKCFNNMTYIFGQIALALTILYIK